MHRRRFKEISRFLTAAPFLAPGLLLVIVLVLYPMLVNVRISLSDFQILTNRMTFTGLKNYIALLGDPSQKFWLAYRNNLLYGVVVTASSMFLGLVCAVMINSQKRGGVFFRTAYYLPIITSWVIVALVFRYLFNANRYGLVNYILKDVLHILPDYVSWLLNEWTANLVIWILGIWKTIGWVMVIYLAALQGVSKEYYEAASIEGAGGPQRFFLITVPLIKPTTYYLLVNLVIGSFNVFLQVWLLTGGGPLGRTNVLNYLMYDRTFNLFQFGEGAAIGVLSALNILVITVLTRRLLLSREY